MLSVELRELFRKLQIRIQLDQLLFYPGHEPGGIAIVHLSQHVVGQVESVDLWLVWSNHDLIVSRFQEAEVLSILRDRQRSVLPEQNAILVLDVELAGCIRLGYLFSKRS